MSRIISWQVIVASSGTPVAGPDIDTRNISKDYYIKALPTNDKIGYVGNDGNDTVDTSTGFALSPGEVIPWNGADLSELWFDMESGGDGQGFCIWAQ